jgi:hypothetical protein
MIKNHTELLNALIEKYGLKSYLEIGINNPANNFDKIKLKCESKKGVDPDVIGENIWKSTSDIFFNALFNNDYPDDYKNAFDLIFIDGLHTADQVKRDFENSLRCLSDNGYIVIHDVLPENEEGTIVPRITKQWWGDVYKWAMNISQYAGIRYKTFDIDNGCMLVYKDAKILTPERAGTPFWDYKDYIEGGKQLMNVTSTVEI